MSSAYPVRRMPTRERAATKNVLPNTFEHARKFGYDESFHVIAFLLKECENTKSEEERTKITEKLFNYLIQNPTILIYQPILRNAVMKKMMDLELYIQKRVQRFNHAKYDEAINMMNTASDVFIYNKKTRDNITSHLNELTDTLEKYKQWAKANTLMTAFTNLKITLATIKNDPNYIPDEGMNRAH
jgi:hypothetical protein